MDTAVYCFMIVCDPVHTVSAPYIVVVYSITGKMLCVFYMYILPSHVSDLFTRTVL